MDDKIAKIIFQPSGRRGEVPKEITIIEASRMLGADIEALCGEKKVCGKCKVRIEEGYFEKYGIDSKKSNVSEWQEEEEKFGLAGTFDRQRSRRWSVPWWFPTGCGGVRGSRPFLC